MSEDLKSGRASGGINWVDYPKCSLGLTETGEWYFLGPATASSYASQMEGDRTIRWYAMSSAHGSSMVGYASREDAKRVAESKEGTHD